MTQNPGDFPSAGSDPTARQPTVQIARDEAANVGRSARDAGTNVTATAADQARQVVSETGRQARGLLSDVGEQAREQAAAQQRKTAQGLHTFAAQLDDMAAKSGESGMATQFAQETSHRLHEAASWLERRQPGDLLHELRDLARRRPGAFLLGAAAAGVVAGRLTRGLAAQGEQDSPASGVTTAGGTGWRPDGPIPAGQPRYGSGYDTATTYHPAPGFATPGPDPSAGYQPTATDPPGYGGAATSPPGPGDWNEGVPGDEPTYRPGQP